MLTNRLMRTQLVKINWTEIGKNCLTYELESIVSEGFIEICGCFCPKNYFHIANQTLLTILKTKFHLNAL